MSIYLFESQEEWERFNSNISKIFDIKYTPTSYKPIKLAEEKIPGTWLGLKHTEETIIRMKQYNPSEETRKKIGDSHRGTKQTWITKMNKNRKLDKVCPHCDKTIGYLNYGKWHGDKCKLKV
jgi:hypothetical protein